MGGVERNFLLRLAQSGGDGVGITFVQPPAGKGDLPRMLAQMGCAAREDHARIRPIRNRDQHGGRDKGNK